MRKSEDCLYIDDLSPPEFWMEAFRRSEANKPVFQQFMEALGDKPILILNDPTPPLEWMVFEPAAKAEKEG